MSGHPGFAGRSTPDSVKATSPIWDLLCLSTEQQLYKSCCQSVLTNHLQTWRA